MRFPTKIQSEYVLETMIIVVAIIVVAYFYRGRKGKRRSSYEFSPISRNEYMRIHEVLEKNMVYYQRLSRRGKAQFINRIRILLKTKRFEAKEDLEITPEIKVMCMAALTQITFGLDTYDFDAFHTVMVYPRSFYVQALNLELKGGATPDGFLMFSAEDLFQGYSQDGDGYNLGLHEAAHAMKIQLIAGEENDERFKMYLQEWLTIGENEYNKLRSGIPGYLRSYAGENTHEFFAVCVEHFFEAPDKLKAHLPDIYNHMCVLLNQNPLNEGDYYLTDEYMHTVNTDSSLRRMPRIVRKVKP